MTAATTTTENTELESFLLNLFGIGAVKINTKPGEGWKMKIHESKPETPLSPIYVNLRVKANKDGPLSQEDVARIAYFFEQTAAWQKLSYAGIAGIPRAGEPFAESLQHRFYHGQRHDVPRLTLHKDESGNVRSIGKVTKTQNLPRGSRVLLLDDLITHAGSKVEAVNQLRNANYIVEDCIVFLDREQGGPEEMQKHGVRIHAVTTLGYVLDFYVQSHLITEQDRQTIRDYVAKY